MLLKYQTKQIISGSKVKIVIGLIVAECRIPFHPLYSQVKQIHLKENELNIKCVQLLEHGVTQIPIQKSKEFVTRCKQVFGLDVKLNTVELAINKMVICNSNSMKILDLLQFNDLLEVIKESFDKTAKAIHGKIVRKLKSYIKSCQREDNQKKMLEELVKIYKQYQQIQDEQKIEESQTKGNLSTEVTESTTKEKKKSAKGLTNEQEEKDGKVARQRNKQRRRQKKQTSQRRGPRGNIVERLGSFKSEKQDQKIQLGIYGDSQEGWRKRNRPGRLAKVQLQVGNKGSNLPKQQKIKQTSNSKQINKQSSQKSLVKIVNVAEKSEIKQMEVQQIEQNITLIDNKQMKLIYTYAATDKKKFNFRKLKSEFALLINENIWVKYFDKTLTIMKDGNGYIRKTKIDLLANGLMAQGLTISLDGNSNIQDGGDDMLGNPTIQEFTGSASQFFNVTSMKAYVPK